MKFRNSSVSLPVYHIESDVTYHTERKPTVFERMVLRLCDPGFHFPDKQSLSLMGVFHNQLGAGDVRELLEGCVSELAALGALSKTYGRDTLDAPLTGLELTADGLQFLRSDRLPVRSRTVKLWHRYDPISDEIKPAKNDRTYISQSNLGRVSVTDQALRPKNPLPLVEHAIGQEFYDWKNPATFIDDIRPVVQLTGSVERTFEVSCNEDGVLSISAPRDTALQIWLDQAEPELIWEIMLADMLAASPDSLLPIIDSFVLRDAHTARSFMAANGSSGKVQLCVVAQDVSEIEAATPTIVLSSVMSVPTLVADSHQPSVTRLHVPFPKEMINGFSRLSVQRVGGAAIQVEVAGNLRLYWAGQPRVCSLTVMLKDQAAISIWAKLRKDLESICVNSDDPSITFLPLAWQDADTISETFWLWLAKRTEQSLDELMELAENAKKAINLWRPDRKDWKSAWEASLAKAIDESFRHTPNQLEPGEVVSLLIKIAQMLSADKAVPLQNMLLRHTAPVRTIEQLAGLRAALPSTVEIPEELVTVELCQIWLENALERKELKLYGPHAMQQPLQNIEKAVQDVYRNIGEQALKAASNGHMDSRTLTPYAMKAVSNWRKAAESYHALNASSPLWDALNEAVESWNLLAEEMLAPVEIGRRIVVFDTSALMEHPEVLQGPNSRDILVVPHRVLSELDGLKISEDEIRSAKARAAIRKLDIISSRIRHETEYTTLLPTEWDDRQPDHAILSTALFFRLNEVLFVSNDINLRNKAQSLGINTQDSKSYAPVRLEPAAVKSKHSPKQDKRKSQRK